MISLSDNYPGLAEWVDDWGWVEIGGEEGSASLVRVIDEGGLVWESPDEIRDIDTSLHMAEEFIAKWIEENQ